MHLESDTKIRRSLRLFYHCKGILLEISTDTATWHEIQAIATMLHERLDEEAAEIAGLLQSKMAPYAALPRADVFPGVRTSLRFGIAGLADRRLPLPEELEHLAGVAELRARQGIPLELVLDAYRVGAHQAWGVVAAEGRRREVPPQVLLQAVDVMWSWTDTVTSHVASAHRRAELELARHHQQHRTDFLRGLVTGSLDAQELRAQALPHGLDAARDYRAFRARGDTRVPLYVIERALLAGGAHLVGILDGDLAGIASTRLTMDLGTVTVGMGPPSSLSVLPTSFAEATRVLRCAVDFAMYGVLDQDALGLRVAVSVEDSIGDLLVERLLAPLRQLRSGGSAVEEAVRAYLAEGQRIEPAARSLFVHPNTLRYRLRKFQEATGADLTSTETLVQVWWALERARCTPA